MKLDPISKYAVQETRLRLKRFSKNLRHAAKHPEDPEAIHDLRVSIRRVTQSCRTFRGLLDPVPVKKLRRRLRQTMDLCGSVRNCDVAFTLLDQVGITTGASVSRLKKVRGDAAEELHRRLKEEREEHGTHETADLRASRHPAESDWKLSQSLEDNLRRVLPALAEEFFDAGQRAISAHASHQTLHQFRLRAKRFRYTLELFEGFYAKEMTQGAKVLKQLQDRLGAINDCAVTIELLGRDWRAVAAIGKLLRERKTTLQTYARGQFTPQRLNWWKHWLARPAVDASSRPTGEAAS